MRLGSRYSQHSFSQTPAVRSPRSVFNRSFSRKSTYNFDALMPFFVDEILPGDTINLDVAMFARMSTQLVPLLDRAYLDLFFFFVPTRLVWDNWEKFNGAQDDPGDSTDFTIPQLTGPAVTGFVNGTMYDHMGLPTGSSTVGLSVNALPFRALCKISNDWFRDQNFNDSIPFPKDNGPDATTDYVSPSGWTPANRNRKHDYFSSGLPWPQKGDALTIPMAATAPITGLGVGGAVQTTVNTAYRETGGLTPSTAGWWAEGNSSGLGAGEAYFRIAEDPANPGYPLVLADTSDLAGTINELRQAMQVQSLLELDARGGTRYVEILLAHWNVISPDFRLQRSEFLSSAVVEINSHPVPQTSSTTGTEYQAQLASFATAASSGNRIGFTKSFVEHGYVIGLLCPRGEVSYQQGLNRMWSRETRFDFFWPKLQQIGEQAVLGKELVWLNSPSEDEAVMCYQERYADYKFMPSIVTGQFRSNYAQSLDSWHLAQEYNDTMIPMNDDFLAQFTPIDRNLAVETGVAANLLVDFAFNYRHARVMLANAVPVSLGRL